MPPMIEAGPRLRLRDVPGIKDMYILPRDPFVAEALIPSLQAADAYWCMSGFFGSESLRELAPGFAGFISRTSQPVQLLISPNVDEDDQRAIKEGLVQPMEVLESRLLSLLGEPGITESALANHTLDCLSYLLAAEKIEIRVGLVRGGLFHLKVWAFSEGGDWILYDGSPNMTGPGLSKNIEQVRVERSWEDRQSVVVDDLRLSFKEMWEGRWPDLLTIDLPEAVRKEILKHGSKDAPTPADYWAALQREFERERRRLADDEAEPSGGHRNLRFEVPAGLVYESGRYEHQGRAITAWESSQRHGILEMATGAGKTKTSLVAAHRLFEATGRLLIIVAVPSRPLLAQWTEEVRQFGLRPMLPGTKGKLGKLVLTEAVLRRLTIGASKIECLVVTHDLLSDKRFQKVLADYPVPTLLIADEVHNLGRESFITDPPESIGYRLGLSATPIRQYDQTGTDALIRYFGDIVFSFTLSEAIGTCLVPYDYHVVPVELTGPETLEWIDLTNKLRARGWRGDKDDKPDQYTTILLNRRRDILEGAEGKIAALRALLTEAGPRAVHHTLIYTSDKGPEQILAVNQLLQDLGVLYHQITDAETSQGSLTPELLKLFREGTLQVLTAKRVLDEGVDIPEVDSAYILASTTVERQWVQRRGRVLRQAPGKEDATIYDFVVLPPENFLMATEDARTLLRGELTRISEFAELARNALAPDGPRQVISTLTQRYFS